MRCMPSFSKNLFLASKNNDDAKTILACSFVTHLHCNSAAILETADDLQDIPEDDDMIVLE